MSVMSILGREVTTGSIGLLMALQAISAMKVLVSFHLVRRSLRIRSHNTMPFAVFIRRTLSSAASTSSLHCMKAAASP